MLSEIRINDLGVIDQATAEFHPGFTALTGETGAGKTMIVTGLNLLGGARADAGRIRAGRDRAVVEGRFETTGLGAETAAEVDELLSAAGCERDEDGSVIAVRTLARDGRSRAHLGGRSVPAGTLAGATGALLTVHGQNDQLRLLRADRQREALDRYAGEAAARALADYQQVYDEWSRVRAELDDRTARARELAQETDRLTFGIEEIRAVDPLPGEDTEIAAEVRRLGDLDRLRDAAEHTQVGLSGASAFGGDDAGAGVIGLLGGARDRIQGVDDPELRVFLPRLEELVVLATELSADVAGYLGTLPGDGDGIDALLSRQADLKKLTKKYAADIDGVLAWAQEAEERLAGIDVSADALDELRVRVAELGAQVVTAGTELTAARTAAATALAAGVTAELAGLAMGRARLEVTVAPIAAEPESEGALQTPTGWVRPARDGFDAVEMLLGTHPDADALPIGKSASGGELSRVMLAMEVVLAGREHGGTLVFDEVDAGVGGRAAVEIGRRLAALSRSHQVIVVTHLPQVAAFADAHLVIGKTEGDSAMVSTVRALDADERIGELARMLAGLDDTETGRAHAEELLAAAAQAREDQLS